MEPGPTRQLSNTFWALSKILYVDEPLSDAIAAQSLQPLSDFGLQGLSNTAWACSTLLF